MGISQGKSPVNPVNIPPELKCRSIFAPYKVTTDKKGKDKKVPINLHTGQAASSTEPSTWSTFDEAYAYMKANGLDGLNIMLRKINGVTLAGLDFDHCVGDDGSLSTWAWDVIKKIDSYTEISPSGHGIRILVNTDGLPSGGRKNGDVEIYDDKHALSITGNHVDGTPSHIGYRPKEVIEVWEKLIGSNGRTPHEVQEKDPVLADAEILEKLFKAKNSEKFSQLNAGHWQGYNSQSEAELAFCGILAFYSQNIEQIDRLYRKSGLYRDKWDSKRGDSTYGRGTILEALANTVETYSSTVKEEYKDSSNSLYVHRAKQSETSNETYRNKPKHIETLSNFLNERNLSADDIAQVVKIFNDFSDSTGSSDDKKQSLTQALRDWIADASGYFTVTQAKQSIEIRNKSKHFGDEVRTILNRLSRGSHPIIKRYGNQDGAYIRIDDTAEEVDWRNASLEEVRLNLPLGIREKTRVYPRYIIVVAGTTGMGKTHLAMHAAWENQKRHKINYLTNELNAPRFKSLVQPFGKSENEWTFNPKMVYGDYADNVQPDALNIIDYLEDPKDAWEIKRPIREIQRKLTTGGALILIQKKPNAKSGTGGEYSKHASDLYICLDWETLWIEKNRYRDADKRPELNERKFTIENGFLKPLGNWHESSNR